MQKPNTHEVLAFTQIPNSMIDYWLGHLSGSEFKVLIYIARRIYGWQDKEYDEISLNQFCEGIIKKDGDRMDYGTGLTKETVVNSIRGLEERGLIKVKRLIGEIDGRCFTSLYYLNTVHECGKADCKCQSPLVDKKIAAKTQRRIESTDASRKPTTVEGYFGRGVGENSDTQKKALQNTVNKRKFNNTDENEEEDKESIEPEVVSEDQDPLHRLWREVFVSDLSVFSRKEKQWVEQFLLPKFPEEKLADSLRSYSESESGKPTLKRYQEFVQGGKRPVFRNTRSSDEDDAGAARGGFRKSYSLPKRQAPRLVLAPMEATEWNTDIHDKSWHVWDAKLNSLWVDASGSPGWDWAKLLGKCRRIAPHKSDLNLNYALRNWASILNGTHDWLFAEKKESKAKSAGADEDYFDRVMEEFNRQEEEKKKRGNK